jgi:hypothetical protein
MDDTFQLPVEPPPLNASRFAEDSKLHVRFEQRPKFNATESKSAGRAIYGQADYIQIMTPGDKTTVIDREATTEDKRRFSEHYERFKAGRGDEIVGTPLMALPGMNPAKVEEYKYFKINTVEQLAAASDALGQNFMAFYSDKARAKAFLEVAANNAPIEAMMSEIQAQKLEMDNMRSQLDAVIAQNRQLLSDAKVA